MFFKEEANSFAGKKEQMEEFIKDIIFWLVCIPAGVMLLGFMINLYCGLGVSESFFLVM